MERSLSLGLEFSTQSGKAVLLDLDEARVIHSEQVSYDEAFPAYGTRGGVLPNEDPAVRRTPPAMLLEAMDLLFARLWEAGAALEQVRAVKLDAQQHCTVYTDASLAQRLDSLEDGRSLAKHLGPAFSRPEVPIWEDRSTGEEVRRLEEALAGRGGLQMLTGNRGEPRFPAAQILGWADENPRDYDRTAHIFVLSAFLTSVLTGRITPVDTGDGWGTNLNSLDLRSPGWNPAVLEAMEGELRAAGCRSGLAKKLGEMRPYDTPAGPPSTYFSRRYGLSPAAEVLCGTGDNPATLLGCGGELVISLGSSYTVNGTLQEPSPEPGAEYNIFGYIPDSAMGLSVITNGAKLHDHFRGTYLGGADWGSYARSTGGRKVREEEPLMLPFLQAESVPQAQAGIRRLGLDEADARANIRALHISQVLSLRLHAGHISKVDQIAVVGGQSQNDALRRFLTDAFGVPSYRIAEGEAAAPLGCAIAAARHSLGISYRRAAERFVQAEPRSRMEPELSLRPVYEKLLARYAELERQAAEG
jgi:xylulokinase